MYMTLMGIWFTDYAKDPTEDGDENTIDGDNFEVLSAN